MDSAWTWVPGWKGNPVRREEQAGRRVQSVHGETSRTPSGWCVSQCPPPKKPITVAFLLTVRGQGRCRYSEKAQPLKGSHRVKKQASRLEQHSKRMLPGSGDILTAPFLLMEKPVFNSYLSKQKDKDSSFPRIKDTVTRRPHGIHSNAS